MPANDPSLRSWIDIRPADDFSLQNLPFGVMETPEWGPRLAVAIGGYALDLYACAQLGYFDSIAEGVPALGAALPQVFRRRSLNAFLRLGRPAWRAVRERVSELLRHDNPDLRDNEAAIRSCLLRQRDVTMLRPVKPVTYGAVFRPDNPLLPNWRHLPVADPGRANSIVVSGTDVRRPQGQYRPAGQQAPVAGPTQQLDFELETAFIVGQSTRPGDTVPIAEAENHIFGLVLLNDWSARDIQSREYQPPGPLPGKSFASSVSPWVITLDALEPFRVAGPAQEPTPLPYLQAEGAQHFAIQLEVLFQPAGATAAPLVLSRSNMQYAYWSMAQQLTQASSGGPLAAGDLYASGTSSGPTPGSLGSLLELTRGGTQPLQLPGDLQLGFLRDGDTIILRGYAERDGVRIGLGEVRGTVLPAVG